MLAINRQSVAPSLGAPCGAWSRHASKLSGCVCSLPQSCDVRKTSGQVENTITRQLTISIQGCL